MSVANTVCATEEVTFWGNKVTKTEQSWEHFYPEGVDIHCSKKALETLGKEVRCNNHKIQELYFNFPVRAEYSGTYFLVSFSEEHGFSKGKDVEIPDFVESDWILTIFMLIIPTLVIFITSNDLSYHKKKLFWFYVVIIGSIPAVVLINLINYSYTGVTVFIYCVAVVIFVYKYVEDFKFSNGFTVMCTTGFTGGYTYSLGWENAMILEYTAFLAFICFINWLFHELKDRHKNKVSQKDESFKIPGG